MNIPNILSAFRLALVPVFVMVYFSQLPSSQYIGVTIVLVAFFTDVLDGFLARHLNQITTLGKILDPLADKLMQIAGIVCVSYSRPEMFPVVAFLLIKEALLGIGTLIISKKRVVAQANWFGKIASFVNVVFLIALLIPINFSGIYLYFGSVVVVLFNAAALGSYFVSFIKIFKNT